MVPIFQDLWIWKFRYVTNKLRVLLNWKYKVIWKRHSPPTTFVTIMLHVLILVTSTSPFLVYKFKGLEPAPVSDIHRSLGTWSPQRRACLFPWRKGIQALCLSTQDPGINHRKKAAWLLTSAWDFIFGIMCLGWHSLLAQISFYLFIYFFHFWLFKM